MPHKVLSALMIAGACIAMLVVGGVAKAAPSDQVMRSARAVQPCANFSDHPTESCQSYATAYIAEAHTAQQLYFKYVHSPIALLRTTARRSYFSTYSANARSAIRSWIDAQPGRPDLANWPVGSNSVDGPTIDIRTTRASLKCHRAVLTTVESLQVRDNNGNTLYSVSNQPFTLVLRHTGGLHFIVERIYNYKASPRLC